MVCLNACFGEELVQRGVSRKYGKSELRCDPMRLPNTRIPPFTPINKNKFTEHLAIVSGSLLRALAIIQFLRFEKK